MLVSGRTLDSGRPHGLGVRRCNPTRLVQRFHLAPNPPVRCYDDGLVRRGEKDANGQGGHSVHDPSPCFRIDARGFLDIVGRPLGSPFDGGAGPIGRGGSVCALSMAQQGSSRLGRTPRPSVWPPGQVTLLIIEIHGRGGNLRLPTDHGFTMRATTTVL